MDSLSRFIDIVIIVVGVYIVSTLISASLVDRIIEENVTVITTNFSDNVRRQGRLTQGMYDAFIDELDATGMLFSIEMTYSKKVLTPKAGSTVATTEECYYYDDLMAGLYSGSTEGGATIDGSADGEVRFNKEDTFYVCVTNRSDTYRTRYGKLLPWIGNISTSIRVHSGGLVRDENWGD